MRCCCGSLGVVEALRCSVTPLAGRLCLKSGTKAISEDQTIYQSALEGLYIPFNRSASIHRRGSTLAALKCKNLTSSQQAPIIAAGGGATGEAAGAGAGDTTKVGGAGATRVAAAEVRENQVRNRNRSPLPPEQPAPSAQQLRDWIASLLTHHDPLHTTCTRTQTYILTPPPPPAAGMVERTTPQAAPQIELARGIITGLGDFRYISFLILTPTLNPTLILPLPHYPWPGGLQRALRG